MNRTEYFEAIHAGIEQLVDQLVEAGFRPQDVARALLTSGAAGVSLSPRPGPELDALRDLARDLTVAVSMAAAPATTRDLS